MRFEEFAGCQGWWGGQPRRGRKENENAWRVAIGEFEKDDRFDLDRKNPHGPEDLAHRPPGELVTELLTTEAEITRMLEEIRSELAADS
jgi:type I restriction enzyme M protein